jgi:hypothetical protein
MIVVEMMPVYWLGFKNQSIDNGMAGWDVKIFYLPNA